MNGGFFSRSTPHSSLLTTFKLPVGVDPGFGKIDDKLFRVLARLEAVGETIDAVRAALAVVRPSNFGSRGPLLVALVLRREGDDQTIVVVKVCHPARNYSQLVPLLPTIKASSSTPFRLQSVRGTFQHTRRAES